MESLEETLPHAPPNAITTCAHFRRNRCRHGLSGKFPVGNKKECETIHPQLCWQFLRHRQGEDGCQYGVACKQLHPRICQKSWKTGKCDKGGMCEDGYHFGEGPGKPKAKDRYGIYCGTPMGLKEGPFGFMVKNLYGSPRRQSKKASRRTTENPTETDKTTRGDQDATKGVTIQVNNTVTT